MTRICLCIQHDVPHDDTIELFHDDDDGLSFLVHKDVRAGAQLAEPMRDDMILKVPLDPYPLFCEIDITVFQKKGYLLIQSCVLFLFLFFFNKRDDG